MASKCSWALHDVPLPGTLQGPFSARYQGGNIHSLGDSSDIGHPDMYACLVAIGRRQLLQGRRDMAFVGSIWITPQ